MLMQQRHEAAPSRATFRCCNKSLQHHLVAASTRGSTITATLSCCNETLLQRHTSVLVPHRIHMCLHSFKLQASYLDTIVDSVGAQLGTGILQVMDVLATGTVVGCCFCVVAFYQLAGAQKVKLTFIFVPRPCSTKSAPSFSPKKHVKKG